MVIKQLKEEIQGLHQNLVLIFKQLDASFGLFYDTTHLSVPAVCVYLCGGDGCALLSPLCSETGGICIMNTNESPPPSTGVLPHPLLSSPLLSSPLLSSPSLTERSELLTCDVNLTHTRLSGNILSTLSSFISADSLTDWTSSIRNVSVPDFTIPVNDQETQLRVQKQCAISETVCEFILL